MSKARRTYYVSFNQQEIDKLSILASHSEIALYFTLKNLASFETGWVGFFGKQRLSYEGLARKLSRPPSQGKPASVVTKDQVRHLLDRLGTMGLVAKQEIVGDGRLVMLLPLSPIEPEKPTEKETQEQTTAVKPVAEATAKPATMEELLAVDTPGELSVLEKLYPALYANQKGVRAETQSPSGHLEEAFAEH